MSPKCLDMTHEVYNCCFLSKLIRQQNNFCTNYVYESDNVQWKHHNVPKGFVVSFFDAFPIQRQIVFVCRWFSAVSLR